MPDHDKPRHRRPAGLAFAGAALLALGAAAGAVAIAETRPTITMAPATPVAIRTLSAGGIVTIRGRVAEIYGNKFVVEDGSGRALVDTGPEGDRRALVTASEPVTVQGRFERGFLHAAFVVGPDGKALAVGPLAGPPPHGPDRGPGAPPPPPGADGKGPPPPPPAPVTADAGQAPAPAPAPAAAPAG